MALVGEFSCQHQFQVAILGIGGHGLLSHVERFIELMRAAIGVDFSLVAAHRNTAAQVDHLLVCRNCLFHLVLFQAHGSQPFEEDAAVVLLLFGIRAVGVRDLRGIHHLLVNLDGFV